MVGQFDEAKIILEVPTGHFKNSKLDEMTPVGIKIFTHESTRVLALQSDIQDGAQCAVIFQYTHLYCMSVKRRPDWALLLKTDNRTSAFRGLKSCFMNI